ncbi:MAG: methyltransferase domain-containing protein [Eubacteriales bacterium]|nr:methyltransferase domain-containing protein [Eubacteriales bacterium]
MTEEYGKFAEVYDLLMQDVPYAAWSRYLTGLLSAHGVAPGDRVLDCACGTGAFAIRFAQAGYSVTGCDRSPEMLAIAQEKARKAGLSIPFVQQDMRELDLHRPVSAVNCACDGVNYLLANEDTAAFFGSANRALIPGGLLLFDVSSAYKLEHILGGHTFGDDTKGCTYLWRNHFDPNSCLLEMKLAFFRTKESGEYSRFDERHIQRAHTVEELRAALRLAGFEIEEVFGWPGREEPKPESERIQFVAKKRAASTEK